MIRQGSPRRYTVITIKWPPNPHEQLALDRAALTFPKRSELKGTLPFNKRRLPAEWSRFRSRKEPLRSNATPQQWRQLFQNLLVFTRVVAHLAIRDTNEID